MCIVVVQLCNITMHTLFEIYLVLYLLKLLAGQGGYQNCYKLGCRNKFVICCNKISCVKIDNTRLSQYGYIMIVSVLLEQPCNKSDGHVKIVASY